MARAVCCLIGGGGLTGRHLVPILHTSGRETVVYDHLPPEADFPTTEYIIGQYGDDSLLPNLLARCEEVVDMAYASHHKSNFENPITDLLNNAPPSVALFGWALKCHRLRRILFVSSGGTVYGPTTQWPTPETATNHPISPFGITSLTLEKYAFMFHITHRLPVVVARPSNAYGPG
jgi:UDP-glucose 4-epimerase